MAFLNFTCPETRQQAPTSIGMDAASLRAAWSKTVRHQRSLDRTGGLNKGEFLAHRNVHRCEDETANPTIEGPG